MLELKKIRFNLFRFYAKILGYEFKVCSGQTENTSAIDTRNEVFYTQKRYLKENLGGDEFDKGAIHFLVFYHRIVVGSVRLIDLGKNPYLRNKLNNNPIDPETISNSFLLNSLVIKSVSGLSNDIATKGLMELSFNYAHQEGREIIYSNKDLSKKKVLDSQDIKILEKEELSYFSTSA